MTYSINTLAVLIAGLGAFAVGWLWYGALFRKAWMKASGMTAEKMKDMPLTAFQATGLGLITTLLRVYVLAHFANVFGVIDTAGAFQLAFWVWLGFLMVTDIGSVLWEGKSWKLFFINTSHSFTSTVVAALVLTYWR